MWRFGRSLTRCSVWGRQHLVTHLSLSRLVTARALGASKRKRRPIDTCKFYTLLQSREVDHLRLRRPLAPEDGRLTCYLYPSIVLVLRRGEAIGKHL